MLQQKLLLGGWALSFVLALLSGAVVAQGVLRDTRTGEPVIRLDLSKLSDWSSASFRVWGQGTYTLFISSVNHDPAFIGTPFAGTFEVEVIAPDGTSYFQQSYSGTAIEHVLPDNYGDTQLAMLELEDWPLRPWVVKARVIEPDEHFKTAFTEVKLWKQRYDPGMGGLMNYAMIVPAAVFLCIALASSLWLAVIGSKIPSILTLIVFLAALTLFVA